MNVKAWFGPNAAEMVFPIANAFSTTQEETLLDQLKTKSASAYDFGKNWSNGTIHNGLQHGSYHHNSDYHPSRVW